MAEPVSPLRLRFDGAALADNWHALDRMSGSAACGAAVKANGYGLGARDVTQRLIRAGCRDFFVATWAEATEIADLCEGRSLSVFHGVRREDMAIATAGVARPCLNSAEQVKRWREAAGGACDVMVDTGMNRLGLSVEQVGEGLLDGLRIDTLMSHLACADEPDNVLNDAQHAALASLAGQTGAVRMSLCNSAGIALGKKYHMDLTRPGISLYGGAQVSALAPHIRQVAFPEAQVIQRRLVGSGETVGYGSTFTAEQDTQVAILHLGYADGYLRSFSGRGGTNFGGAGCPVIGRVSMDLIAVSVDAAPEVREGDWLAIDYDLPKASAQSGLSQYELLTTLGRRYQRNWNE
ncbi:alanine racemase [Parasphingopyxis lamellibrachiae]|uniref:alanine racemase n=1 Tax=Parasphingopyxis lamellibrachiae TaxID=680125 RepID=A0A3D9FBD4_9SPHN|nr:alanine racemase [Parasphingopyxis lamellibrachiae]RED15154.1 alanine racemase [Parasphingopyxis lamellibrachiae]